MPRIPKGQLSGDEIRNLARQHNKLYEIKNINRATRANLIKQINDMGYTIDHKKKRIRKKPDLTVILSKKGNVAKRKIAPHSKGNISLGKKGAVKPQKRTIAKRARQAFAAQERGEVDVYGKKPKKIAQGVVATKAAARSDRPRISAIVAEKAYQIKKKNKADRMRLIAGD